LPGCSEKTDAFFATRRHEILGISRPTLKQWIYTKRPFLPWCLWCLFGAEIGAIYAEQLKELQHATPWKSPMFMLVSCMLLKTC
jgi:hypothetical protein